MPSRSRVSHCLAHELQLRGASRPAPSSTLRDCCAARATSEEPAAAAISMARSRSWSPAASPMLALAVPMLMSACAWSSGRSSSSAMARASLADSNRLFVRACEHAIARDLAEHVRLSSARVARSFYERGRALEVLRGTFAVTAVPPELREQRIRLGCQLGPPRERAQRSEHPRGIRLASRSPLTWCVRASLKRSSGHSGSSCGHGSTASA